MNDKLLQQLIQIIKDAGDISLKYYKNLDRDYSKDSFPTTIADKAISDFLYPRLKDILDVPILDEERVDSLDRLKSSEVWVVDPIDGTKDFIEETGDFSIMVALVKDNQPILSLIYKPTDDIMYVAEKNKGAYKLTGRQEERVKLKVSMTEELGQFVIVNSRFHISDVVKKFINQVGIKKNIAMGSMGLKMATIAEGRANLYISDTNKTGEWDSATGVLLLQEAGGVVVDLAGNELLFNKEIPKNTNGIIACSNNIEEIINNID